MKRKLVIIQQGGGVDGLNLLIPTDQQDIYQQLRPTVGIKENSQLDLGSEYDLALHPSASSIKELFEMGVARIVQQVAYPEGNQSHFESIDITMSGGDGTGRPTNGSIMGRFLEAKYPDYPTAFPNDKQKGPPGYAQGTAIPQNIWGSNSGEKGIRVISDPDYLYNVSQKVNQAKGVGSGMSKKERMIAIMNAADGQADKLGYELKRAYEAGLIVQVFNEGTISRQLKNVAKLIKGGLDTEVYMVSIGTFDTHNDQVLAGDSTKGVFTEQIEDVYGALLTFQRELMDAGLADEVLTITSSEFGRRVTENDDLGTDHGTAYPMLIVGPGVAPGVSGANANLSNLDSNGDFADFNYDYRQVFATILKKWLGAGINQITAAGLLGFYNQMIDGLIDKPYPEDQLDQDYTGTFTNPVDPDPTKPEAPTNLRAINVDHQGFGILWDYPSNTTGIAGYRVLINEANLQDSDDNYAAVENVASDTEYQVKVASIATDGTLSDWITMLVKTNKETVDPDPDPITSEALAAITSRLDGMDLKLSNHDKVIQQIKDIN